MGEGVAQGFKYFGKSLKAGIAGVVFKPMQGARKEGAVGFVKGVGKGVVGLVAAPVSGKQGISMQSNEPSSLVWFRLWWGLSTCAREASCYPMFLCLPGVVRMLVRRYSPHSEKELTTC